MATTDEFKALKAAEERFTASDSIERLNALEEAERAYFSAVVKAKAEWEAMPVTALERMSAEANAFETEGTAEDELRWFQIAALTAQEIIDFRPCNCAA